MKWLGRLSVLAVVAVLLVGGVLAVQMLRSLP
jgi:penicillin amidase